MAYKFKGDEDISIATCGICHQNVDAGSEHKSEFKVNESLVHESCFKCYKCSTFMQNDARVFKSWPDGFALCYYCSRNQDDNNLAVFGENFSLPMRSNDGRRNKWLLWGAFGVTFFASVLLGAMYFLANKDESEIDEDEEEIQKK